MIAIFQGPSIYDKIYYRIAAGLQNYKPNYNKMRILGNIV